jgi:amidase
MATWIHRFDLPDPVPQGVMRIAVKDAIDVAGVATTAGCVAVRGRALPARADASCLAGVRPINPLAHRTRTGRKP